MSSANLDPSVWSLRARLIRLFAAGGFIAWIVSGSLILLIAQRADTAYRDLALQRSGLIVLKIAQHEYVENKGSLEAIQSVVVLDLPDLIIQVRNHDGGLLLSTPDSPDTSGASSQSGFETVQIADASWRVATLLDQKSGLRVQIAENQAHRDQAFLRLAIALLVPLVLGLPIVMVAAWFLATRALQPLRQAAQVLADRKSSDLSPIQPGELPQEALPLVAAFNKLLQRLTESWDDERRFAASVAHELRTPLAGIRLNLQRLQKSTVEQTTLTMSAALIRAVDRAVRVIEQLLTLAGLEQNIARERECQLLDLRRTVDETLAEFNLRVGERGIRFTIDAEIGWLPIPAQAFYIVLRNFVENAIRHSPSHAVISVSTGRANEWWWLQVEDEGAGISPTTAHEFSSSAETLQIGLSLVRKIADLLGGQLESKRSERLGGACFRFSAPLPRSEPIAS